MKCGPAGRLVVENVATPPDSVAVPSSVLPSTNATVPVGAGPPPSDNTTAASDARCPKAVGLFGATTNVKADAARSRTVTVTGADPLAMKLPSPRYVALNACGPGAIPFTVNAAAPPATAATPTGVPLSKK